MQSATLSFANMHNHGELFANILRARRESFIVKNRWDLPETMGMEFDQYDTPVSRWLAVYSDAGAGPRRGSPYAHHRALRHLLLHDPRRATGALGIDSLGPPLREAPVVDGVWEVTRGFVAADIPASLRHKVRLRLVMQMLKTSREEGIRTMLALLPVNWDRWAARCKLEMRAAGREMDMGGILYQAVWIDFTGGLH
jgi:N-acyl-L-homoserine lactone synthetase